MSKEELLKDGKQHKTFLVIAADMETYDRGDDVISGSNIVFTSATNSSDACIQATKALQRGIVPVEAFSEDTLAKLIEEFSKCSLRPGESFNRSEAMTEAQIQAEYWDD